MERGAVPQRGIGPCQQMRSDYLDRKTATEIMAGMTPTNMLICTVAMNTGLRIDDVCALKTADIQRARQKSGWLVVTEQKTGKRKTVRFRYADLTALYWHSGAVYVFPKRNNPSEHRTRQAVWKDLARCAAAHRVKGLNVSPHSLRKLYAVEQYDKHGDLQKVQKQLNHDNVQTTMMYALSREMGQKKKRKKRK